MRRAAVALLATVVVPALAGSARAQTAGELPEAVAEYVKVQAPVVALTGVQVVDGTGAPPIANATVVIRDGVIEAVGADVEVPAGAEVLDLPGHTVIPGIVGLHDHTFYTTAGRRVQLHETAPKLYLGAGVTTIRSTGSYHPYAELNLRRAIEAGELPGPRVHVTGPYLTGGVSGYMTIVDDPEEARRVVGYWADEGATWFKVYTRISRSNLAAVIEEAHRRGLKVTGHICSVSFREAAELGIDNLEHGFFTNSDYVPDKVPDECPDEMRARLLEVDLEGPEVQATFRDMIDNNVAMTSTLVVYEISVAGRPPIDERVYDVLAPEIAAEVREIAEARRAGRGAIDPDVYRKATEYEVAFVKAGGLLAAGVDPTGYGAAPPGLGDQRNFELLIEAGFSTPQVVQIMSANGAKVLGISDEVGTVEAGKVADLVVVEGDLEALGSLRTTRIVFRQGVGWSSEKLVESIRGIVGIR
jgi:imidazolonepropionase-like amidohydrolase